MTPIHPLSIVLSFVAAAVTAYFAHRRGKNPYLWFAIGLAFGIFGVFAFLFASSGKKTAIAVPPKPAPILTIQGPIDKFWYYVDPANQQQGPMSRDALSAAWKEGKIDLTTYVWHEELTEWKPLRDTLKAEGG